MLRSHTTHTFDAKEDGATHRSGRHDRRDVAQVVQDAGLTTDYSGNRRGREHSLCLAVCAHYTNTRIHVYDRAASFLVFAVPSSSGRILSQHATVNVWQQYVTFPASCVKHAHILCAWASPYYTHTPCL
jgi:hypothetical protein